ncbi:uncharacterized protein LOC110834693 isoform X1 [Zootermopsis nevadensis]|uniref:aralkylamine N-acetyltransferase n=1 Tax=Zootermopsis nevadensis TaxID=136037 RepID=A0A067QW07_ZOONE|nr:uncharacterized protein LOC110834693 isoform X1 [Zootermopsis nevadensis]KDR14224.1 hypothetical protein L798_11764 [Zootermopsis nevadensis]
MKEDYDIISATEEYRDRIVEFLRECFFKHEPLNVCSGAPPNRPAHDMDSLPKLSEGMSLLAVSRNGQRILGVCINGAVKPDAEKQKEKTYTHPAYTKISNFIWKFIERADTLKTTGADCVMFVYLLGVDEAARGRGIGRALMEKSRENARCAGYPMIAVVCSSYFSARIARNIGMQSVYSLSYSEYLDEDGHPVFKPLPPHTEISLLVQKLSSETEL